MKQPNILLILIDDMGWKDLSCYGSDFYETPNLDRLAQEGIRFTDAYAACPVCSPTRASMLTGKYPASIGVTDWIDHGGTIHPARGKLIDVPYLKYLPLHERTVASYLREGGYNTWHVGKWHLGGEAYYPEKHGLDVNIGGCQWGMPYNGYFSPYGIPTLDDGPEGEYLTDRLTDEAIRLIGQKDDRPFFLNLWHYAVHTPIQAKTGDIERFAQKAQAMGLDQIDPFEIGESFPMEHKKHLNVTRRRLQSDPVYAAMVYNLDWNIGRLLQALEAAGEADHTLIVFTSDNGGLATSEGSPTCNAPLSEGKGWMYEGGVREPLIIRWPGVIDAGRVSSEPVTTPDIAPTLLEAAGLGLAGAPVDGVSLMPVLRGEADSDVALKREAIYWHYPHYGNQGGTPGSSMRMGDYKLIEFFETGALELYDLRNDIEEQRNLVLEERDLAMRMHRMLIAWRESVEAKIPLANAAWS
ncbi:sulfatase [Paenibacillus cremeus]|uniref:Sulfatase n=1 Tax=Paenibacillus cremeus TaxID=2163881 RepID=A0A559KAT0_9BACL|nr:sulfatase [Paenibacillus cremeus]TVY09237.1 sulfatase [Paenibacillus cremeus]